MIGCVWEGAMIWRAVRAGPGKSLGAGFGSGRSGQTKQEHWM